ncbi:MAG: bifunctional sugar-1-phosphate nucleotidylyltransferase/acetyltransferase [Candidatus Ranarchaeia archaeon]
MKGLILAAGRGKRLSPITDTRPKPMIPIGGSPILQYIIENLRENGITEIVIVVGYKGEMIKDYFKTGIDFGVRIEYVIQEEPVGVEDAILTAAPLLKDEASFVLCHADILCDKNMFHRTIQNHVELETNVSIATTLVEHPEFYGIVEIDEEARVKRVSEKPKPEEAGSHYAVAGVYVFQPDLFSFLERNKKLDRTIQTMIDDGKKVFASVWEKEWVSVTYPWDLLLANQFLLRQLFKGKGSFIHESAQISSQAAIKGPAYISDNVVVRPGASIIGPVYIGSGSYIGTNTLIREYASIGKNVIVGFGVEVKNSVLFDGCHIGRLSYIGDSIIGQDVQFGAGTQTQNVQPHLEPPTINILGEKTRMPLNKFGVLLGDNATLGINISIHPGIKLGEGCIISPGTLINEDVPAQTKVEEVRTLKTTKLSDDR